MENVLFYSLKIAVAIAVLFLAYLVFFQNRKLFTFNRNYLLASLFIAYIIPLITITVKTKVEPFAFVVPVKSVETGMLMPVSGSTKFILEWYHYLFIFYIVGLTAFLFHLVIGHLKAISIIRKSRKQCLFETQVFVSDEDIHPFSFFNTIVISKEALTHPNLEMIINHEKIHVKEKHTFDILIAEILFLPQWFNPFAWLVKDAVKNNLEYKTDFTITKFSNRETYQLAMVSLAGKKGVAPFLTALNGSQLKNRIIMMKKKTENKFVIVKQLLILPLLAILVMGLSNKKVQPVTNQDSKTVNGIVNNKKSDVIPIVTVITEKIIKGKVTNEKGKSIPGVNVIIKGKHVGTVTDKNGNYIIRLENKNETLIFSLNGFTEQEILVNDSEEINVQLKTDSKSDLTGIFNVTKPEKLKIPGKVSAPSVKEINDSIKIKYVSKPNQPIYIVDGKEIEDIKLISPDEIESISVLKGESAGKKYGDKGKHGVIVITTKGAELSGKTHQK